MPTSGEARIRPTSTYNLRSRPLPRAKKATAGVRTTSRSLSKNKENVKQPGGKDKQSRIPVPVKTTPAAKATTPADSKASPACRSKRRVRPVPDFAKLHKSWQSSFNKGKACSKKQCTQIREFDLTKPGTVFHARYHDGKHVSPTMDEWDEDIFQSDDEALQSILNAGLPASESQQQGRLTVAGYGGSGFTQAKPGRQTLGALPSTFQGRADNTQNIKTTGSRQVEGQASKPALQNDPLEQEQHKGRNPSLAEQQQGMDINFEPDAGALASILNNTGTNFQRQAPAVRQTIGTATGAGRNHESMYCGRQSQGPMRTSIYYQRPRNMNFNRVYTDFANHILSRLSLAENMVPSSNSQPLERLTNTKTTVVARSTCKAVNKSHVMMSAPRRMRTPATASRILNPRHHAALRGQDTSCSPALVAPPSALKKPNANKESRALSVKWADILSPPGIRTASVPGKDEVATALFVDEDTRSLDLFSVNQPTNNEGQQQGANIKGKQDQILQLQQQVAVHCQELKEMDEIEQQLLSEIQRLQQDDCLLSPPTADPEERKEQEARHDRAVDSPPLPVVPLQCDQQSLPGKALLQSSSQPQQKQFFQMPEQDSAPTLGVSTAPGKATESLQKPSTNHTDQFGKKPFNHSPGSPFKRSQLPRNVTYMYGLSQPSATPMKFHSESNCKMSNESTSCDASELWHQSLHRPLETLNTPEKPFVEMAECDSPSKPENRSRTPDLRMPEIKMETPQEMLNKNMAAERVEFNHHGCSDDVNPQRTKTSLSQAATTMSSGHLGQNASDGLHTSRRPLGAASRPQLATETDISTASHFIPSGTGEPINSFSQKLSIEHPCSRQESLPNRMWNSQKLIVPSGSSHDLTNGYPQPDSFCRIATSSSFHSVPTNNHESPVLAVNQASMGLHEHSCQPNTDRSGNSKMPQGSVFSSSTTSLLSSGQPLLPNAREWNPQLAGERVSAQMSSTPAHICTPQAVKPHSMIKELTLKQLLPSVSVLGNQPALYSQDIPPIHTPLAMRSMSALSRNPDLEVSPVQFVSPIPMRPGQVPPSAEGKPTSFSPAQHQTALTSDLPSVSLTATVSETEARNSNPLQQESGLDYYPASATRATRETSNFEAVAADDNLSQQYSSRTGNPTSAPTSTQTKATSMPLKEINLHNTLHVIDQVLEATTVGDAGNEKPKPYSHGEPQRPWSHLKFKGQGSLSLGAELMTNRGAAAFLKSKMKPLLSATTNQLFHEALLDEECALYACRLPSKFNPRNAPDRLCLDPVAKILMDGDDMHFVPIHSRGQVYFSSPIGSAFNTYISSSN
ncbi:uncharacterized protein LOC110973509 [Acanthaster planci]|uniref:Uncharacterized protein LOC110973509 n=1 Tax=Acanthaster planci TaxID=133434 RepID=A0A8B7XIP5_ACAPL|nr:uncharacterized protein LOC110973509 [Acanthaster planci]